LFSKIWSSTFLLITLKFRTEVENKCRLMHFIKLNVDELTLLWGNAPNPTIWYFWRKCLLIKKHLSKCL
jgi:hypothetical protein